MTVISKFKFPDRQILLSLGLTSTLLACQTPAPSSLPSSQPAARPSPSPKPSPSSRPGHPAASPTAPVTASPAQSQATAMPAPATALALPAGLASLKLTSPIATLAAKGRSAQLVLSLLDAAGQSLAPGSLSLEWSSSRPQDLSVDAAGLVTALVDRGNSVISVRIQGSDYTASLELKVQPASQSGGGGGSSSSSSTSLPVVTGFELAGTATTSARAGQILTLTGRNLRGAQSLIMNDLGASPQSTNLSASLVVLSSTEVQVTLPASFSDTTPDAAADASFTISNSNGSGTSPVLNFVQTIYADATPTGSDDDGDDWAGAYSDLQDALAEAESGDQVWIAAGTYTPGNTRSVSFAIESGVALYGGFAGSESSLAARPADTTLNRSILSGDLAQDDAYDTDASDGLSHTGGSENSYHVVTAGDGSRLDGLTIQGGTATSSDTTSDQSRGGGIYVPAGSPSLNQLVIRYNSASWGGGLYLGSGSPSLSDISFEANAVNGLGGALMLGDGALASLSACDFSHNQAYLNLINDDSGFGGAIFLASGSSLALVGADFTRNYALYGGAITSRTGLASSFSEVDFSQNFASESGGAIHESGGADITISSVSFSGNQASQNGGAIYQQNNGGLQIDQADFSNNIANYVGGALYLTGSGSEAVSISDSRFSGNLVQDDAGAIYVGGGASLAISDSSLSQNTTQFGIGGGALSLEGAAGLSLEAVTFSANQASIGKGGAIRCHDSEGLDFEQVHLADNLAGEVGGALSLDDCTANIDRTVFESNNADDGGGIYASASRITLSNSAFLANAVLGYGGGLYHDAQSSSSLRQLSFSQNQAGNFLNGAGIYAPVRDDAKLKLFNCLFWQSSDFYAGSELITQNGVNGNQTAIDDPFDDSGAPSGDDGEWFSSDDGLRLASDSSLRGSGGSLDFSLYPELAQDFAGSSRPAQSPDPGAYHR